MHIVNNSFLLQNEVSLSFIYVRFAIMYVFISIFFFVREEIKGSINSLFFAELDTVNELGISVQMQFHFDYATKKEP